MKFVGYRKTNKLRRPETDELNKSHSKRMTLADERNLMNLIG
jgi:hypothetical protein